MIKFKNDNSSITDKMIQEYVDDVSRIHAELHEKANDEKEF